MEYLDTTSGSDFDFAPHDGVENADLLLWAQKKLIDRLDHMRGSGTSLISVSIPAGKSIHLTRNRLTEEERTASNVKDQTNRKSIIDALTSIGQKLGGYKSTPPNGLAIFCGEVLIDRKTRRCIWAIHPSKPLNRAIYLCDSVFHTDELHTMLEDTSHFGFIIIDGNGYLLGELSGDTRKVLSKCSVDLPKKHGRGGQSKLRFERLRKEKIDNYIRKVSEDVNGTFLNSDHTKITVDGLVLAGSADLKMGVLDREIIDPRLAALIRHTKIVDISYGFERGFEDAIGQCRDILGNVKLVKEKIILEKFFDRIATDDKVCYGPRQTLGLLGDSVISELVVWENLRIYVYHIIILTERIPVVKGDGQVLAVWPPKTGENITTVFVKRPTSSQQFGGDGEDDAQWIPDYCTIVDSQPFVEWAVQKYHTDKITLHIVSDRTNEGSQFCRGFGGIGGFLRYAVQTYDETDDGGDTTHQGGLAENTDEIRAFSG